MTLQKRSTDGALLKVADGALAKECCCQGAAPAHPTRPTLVHTVIGDDEDTFSGGCVATINLKDAFFWGTGSAVNPYLNGASAATLTYTWGSIALTVVVGLNATANPSTPPDTQDDGAWAAHLDCSITWSANPSDDTDDGDAATGDYTLRGLYDPAEEGGWTAAYDAEVTVTFSHPMRERLDMSTGTLSLPSGVTTADPAQWPDERTGYLRWEAWPDDGGGTVRIQCGAYDHTFNIPDSIEPWVGGNAVATLNATISQGTAAIFDVCSLQSLTAYGDEPAYTEDDFEYDHKHYDVTMDGIDCWCDADYTQVPADAMAISTTFASAYDFDCSFTAKNAAGGNISSLAAGGTESGFTISSGTATKAMERSNCSLTINGNKVEDTLADYEFSWVYNPSSLTTAKLPYWQFRCPLDVPYTWATWTACTLTQKASVIICDCSNETLWSGTNATIKTSNGALRVTVTDTGASIAHDFTATKAELSTGRYLAFEVTAPANASAGTVVFGSKEWAFSAGTTQSTVTIDLLCPDTLSGDDDGSHSRVAVELARTAGGWAWGEDNARSQTAEDVLGNWTAVTSDTTKAVWSPTMTIELDALGVWLIDNIRLVRSDSGTDYVGFADMVADRSEYQAWTDADFGAETDVVCYGRRGLFALQSGRVALDLLQGWGYEDSNADRQAVPLWIKDMVYIAQRMTNGAKGLIYLTAGVAHPGEPGAGQTIGTGGPQYSTPAQYCNDAQDVQTIRPFFSQWNDSTNTQTVTARIWADVLKFGSGVNLNVASTRYFGGAVNGVLCLPETGGTSGATISESPDSGSAQTDGTGAYVMALSYDDHTISHGASSGSLGDVDCWLHVGLEDT